MSKKPTIKDLLDLKGRRQFTMTNAGDIYTARACEQAGIDIVGGRGGDTPEKMCAVLDQLRKAAPKTLLAFNLPMTHAFVSDEDCVRCAMLALKHGADIIYTSGNDLSRFRAMSRLGIPCAGHVGLVPFRATWIGGNRAVGKTADQALQVYRDVLAFQEAGAFAVEMECVPERVAAEIARRVDILVISLGSGRYCDGQFLYACDLLGTHDDRYPRHVKKYRDFFGESVAAFGEFKADVESGNFPGPGNLIKIDDQQFDGFLGGIEKFQT